jgi:hypothetical protein
MDRLAEDAAALEDGFVDAQDSEDDVGEGSDGVNESADADAIGAAAAAADDSDVELGSTSQQVRFSTVYYVNIECSYGFN